MKLLHDLSASGFTSCAAFKYLECRFVSPPKRSLLPLPDWLPEEGTQSTTGFAVVASFPDGRCVTS